MTSRKRNFFYAQLYETKIVNFMLTHFKYNGKANISKINIILLVYEISTLLKVVTK